LKGEIINFRKILWRNKIADLAHASARALYMRACQPDRRLVNADSKLEEPPKFAKRMAEIGLISFCLPGKWVIRQTRGRRANFARLGVMTHSLDQY